MNPNQQLYILNQILYYQYKQQQYTVSLGDINQASVVLVDEGLFLMLSTDFDHCISIDHNQFAQVFSLIANYLGIETSLFDEALAKRDALPYIIWTKIHCCNYSILTDAVADCVAGFEVLSNPPVFVSWDTTYEQLLALTAGGCSLVELVVSEYSCEVYKIGFPVRVGALMIQGLEFLLDDSRKDIPVQSYYTTLYNVSNNKQSFIEIRDAWLQYLPSHMSTVGVVDKEYGLLCFNLDNVFLSLEYNSDAEANFDIGGTSISFINNREYDTLLEQDETSLVFSEIIHLGNALTFRQDYHVNRRVQTIPTVLKGKLTERSAMWVDHVNSQIGFVGEQLVLIYTFNEIDSICVQNVFLNKDTGYAEVVVKLKLGNAEHIYVGDLHCFDDYSNAMIACIADTNVKWTTSL